MYSIHSAISCGRAGADIAGDIGLGADQLGELHELVGAEAVGLLDAAPDHIDLGRALVARAHALAPVIVVGEAAAGPAHQRHLDGLQGRDHVVAIAPGVGDLAVLADPDALVDAASQVLGELAVDLGLDHRTGLVGAQGACDGGLGAGGAGGRQGGGGKSSDERVLQRGQLHDSSLLLSPVGRLIGCPA
jgi:hypothetical protein